MQISVEEVSRLLAVTPQRNQRQTGSMQASASQTPVSRGAASVEISTSAQELQGIKRQIDRLPDVREDRVQALKAQIENGTYKVSGEDIADLILRRTLADNTAL